jgi:hypothetical protein
MSELTIRSLIPAAVILIIVVAMVIFRSRSGGGFAGMAVCRKCGRAFPRPFMALNLMTGKLVHCPNCGAWAVLPAASQAELDLAAAREKGPETPGMEVVSEEEALRRRIEQSKYEH